MDKQEMFYLQDARSYVGNCPLWWSKDRGGYTCDLDKAGLFTYEEAMKLHEDRSTDIPWKQLDVEKAVKRLVDAQFLIKNDDDGFYSNLEEMKDEKRKKHEKEHQDYLIKNYIENELFAIREDIDFDEVKDSKSFESQFEKAKQKLDWHEHYYPLSYNKNSKDIFEDLIKYELIFLCSECNKYLWSCSKDSVNNKICEDCAIQKEEEENQ